MKKQIYSKPEIDITVLSSEDIVTLSLVEQGVGDLMRAGFSDFWN